ncbi:MAG: ABC transporter substrate-binding protein [Betaproteobacteria bacterium]|nr:ABC transporter substrate-binding protein [Betaproteobacteria bacterium]
MRELGYVEGKNLIYEFRFADNKLDQLPALAAELVALKLDVIVSYANAGPLALQKVTSTTPIVMTSASDPVASGLVKTLGRPGGNITGRATINAELGPERLEMLRDMLPKFSQVAVLLHPTGPARRLILDSFQTAGKVLGIKVLPLETQTLREIEDAFGVMVKHKARALILTSDPLFGENSVRIAALAIKNRLPSMSADRSYAEAGCLASYGTNLRESFRQAATYVDKILKGAKPADLPVEQPMTFELVINLKTAKSLGLKIPQNFMFRVDHVIE